VEVLGASAPGVVLDVTASSFVITMPLAPGDRRVLQIARVGEGYGAAPAGLIPVGIVSESWIETAGPRVTASETNTF
jgi:hypothetical protein